MQQQAPPANSHLIGQQSGEAAIIRRLAVAGAACVKESAEITVIKQADARRRLQQHIALIVEPDRARRAGFAAGMVK